VVWWRERQVGIISNIFATFKNTLEHLTFFFLWPAKMSSKLRKLDAAMLQITDTEWMTRIDCNCRAITAICR